MFHVGIVSLSRWLGNSSFWHVGTLRTAPKSAKYALLGQWAMKLAYGYGSTNPIRIN